MVSKDLFCVVPRYPCRTQRTTPFRGLEGEDMGIGFELHRCITLVLGRRSPLLMNRANVGKLRCVTSAICMQDGQDKHAPLLPKYTHPCVGYTTNTRA